MLFWTEVGLCVLQFKLNYHGFMIFVLTVASSVSIG